MLQRIKDFFKEVKTELKKVVFPTRGEVIGSTRVVIITVFIIAAFLGLIDIWLSRIVSVVLR